GFDYLVARRMDRRIEFGAVEPFGELPGEQLAEEGTDRNAGVKITRASDSVPFLFIVSINWTIKGHLHEVVEGDRASGTDFGADFFNEFLHGRMDGADLATRGQTNTEAYG